MPFAATELTQVMGLGHYVGEVRQGPDGQLYEWVEGVDGLGNPLGFWRGARRALKRASSVIRPLARAALPFTKFIPGAGTAVFAAGTMAQRTGLLGTGATGQIAQGPDGQLYEWVEGVDGLGNPLGFWKAVKRAASGLIQRALPMASRFIPGAGALLPAATGLLRSGGGPGIVGNVLRNLPGVGRITNLTRGFCQALPQLQTCAQQIPETQRPLQMGTQACNALRRVGLAGTGEEMMAGPDGQLYEVVEGIGEDGVVRRALRPVWLSIPATIRPRRMRRGMRPVVAASPAVRALQPGVPVRRMAPMRRLVPVPMARPVRRFR
jgi:hypothetical protein